MLPLTMYLQYTVTLTFLAFALFALDVHRHAPHTPPAPRAAWGLAGYGFLVHAVDKGLQEVFGTAAVLAGSGAPVYESYLAWSPAFNHSRTFMLLGMCAALAVLVWREITDWRRFYLAAAAAMALGLVVGAVVGWQEKFLLELRHYSAVAKWDVVELLVLLAVLFAGLLSSRMDRLLWFCLCVYAFSLSLSVLWFAAFSRIAMEGQWAPRPWEIHLYRTVLNLGMCAIAFHRLRLARRGVRVPALLESPRPRPSMAG